LVRSDFPEVPFWKVWSRYLLRSHASSRPSEALSKLVDLEAELRAQGGLESLLRQVAQHAGKPGKAPIDSLVASLGEQVVRDALCQAMNEGAWFKKMGRARALDKLLLEEGIPHEIEKVLLGFWDSMKSLSQDAVRGVQRG
jgi:hypothetical protein